MKPVGSMQKLGVRVRDGLENFPQVVLIGLGKFRETVPSEQVRKFFGFVGVVLLVHWRHPSLP